MSHIYKKNHKHTILCSKCQKKILPESNYRSIGANKGHLSTKYHLPCVGFMLSRYTFFHIPDPIPEELKWKELYDEEVGIKTDAPSG